MASGEGILDLSPRHLLELILRSVKMHGRYRRLVGVLASSVPAVACGNDSDGSALASSGGTGGTAAAPTGGSAPWTGGAAQNPTGGSPPAAGTSATGGVAVSSGGSIASGGNTATGGLSSLGGKAGTGGGVEPGTGGSALGGTSGATGGGGAAGASGAPSAGAGNGGAGGASGGSANAGEAGAATCSGTTLGKGETTRMLEVGGTSRSYVLHVPSSYSGSTAVPLVLDFHGLGGSGMGERGTLGMATLSDQEGFLVAWPNGIDNAWNIGPCCTESRSVDDLGFAKAIVAQLRAEGCVDSKRVYATGFSMGGGMSHFLACNAADVFAAVAPHAFDLLEESEMPCEPSRPVPVLSFRGTNDNLVPYAGGESVPPNGCCPPIHFLGAEGTLSRWAEIAECSGSPTPDGEAEIYMQCAAGVRIGLRTLQGGGHAPGSGEETWDFLQAYSLP